MNNWWLLFVMSLTVFRITWLITRDSFPPIRYIREQIKHKHRSTLTIIHTDSIGDANPTGDYAEARGPWEWAETLITCYWCITVWASGGVTLLVWVIIDNMPVPLLWFGAVSGASAIIMKIADRE